VNLPKNIEAFAARIGHSFSRPELLIEALTHSSMSSPAGSDNQRLEFLGDRVLALAVADALCSVDRDADEGRLAPRLNALVRKETCAEIARQTNLGAVLKLGRSEVMSGGRRKETVLADAMEAVIAAAPGARAARDATRGGLASALNEIAQTAGCGVELDEDALPLRDEVKGMCEILGLDPLYLANEGTLVLFVPENQAQAALEAMQATPDGAQACIIGRAVADHPATVTMRTRFGGQRIVDMLIGEQLPRIC